jgi:DNA-binding ferritin-like protein
MNNDRLRELSGIKILTENQDKDFDNIFNKIAEQTDQNDHTGSVITLAKFLKDKKSEKILTNIHNIHKIVGNMPSELSKYRETIRKDLMKLAERKVGKEKADKLNGAF